jgi:hypothetical protein
MAPVVSEGPPAPIPSQEDVHGSGTTVAKRIRPETQVGLVTG